MMGLQMKIVFCLALLPAVLWADVESNIPWGIEAVTGYRSESVHRGFKLADDVFDYQLEAEVALSDTWTFNFSAWHATGTGKRNDFSEVSGLTELRYDAATWNAGWMLGYRDFSATFIRDGWETGPFFSYHLSEDLDFRTEFLYDEGAESYYATAALTWSRALGDKSFVSLKGGFSVVDDFYGSDGFHVMDLRFSYTYLVAPNVSFSPFVGTYLGLDDVADDALLGGIWFEVTF